MALRLVGQARRRHRAGERSTVLADHGGAQDADFLPTHLSFREIGERVYVSANTVKTQANAVYRKLGVSCRSEAVSRARQLGLLDA